MRARPPAARPWNVPAVEIRDAVEVDLPRLRAVFRDASWSNQGVRALLARHPELLDLPSDVVAEKQVRDAVIDGNVVGFVSREGAAERWEVEDLFVDPAVMRSGIGQALIADVVERARRLGMGRGEVVAGDAALGFYDRAGFTAADQVVLDHGTAVRMVVFLGGRRRGDGVGSPNRPLRRRR